MSYFNNALLFNITFGFEMEYNVGSVAFIQIKSNGIKFLSNHRTGYSSIY